jgi:hypothetical protein
MASRKRKAVSIVLGALLISASLAAMQFSPAQASTTSPQASSCLIINQQNELVSADFCTGDLVIPASVTTIKTNAFFYFTGAISFEANSQLRTIERAAIFGGEQIRSIIFPPSLTSMDAYAVAATGNNVLYFEGNPAQLNPGAVWQSGSYTLIQRRGGASLGLSTGQYDLASPFQIDCNTIDGGKDIIGRSYVALELHNCRDPRNPAGANPPATMGYILNQDLNESVALQSADGLHQGSVALRRLGDSGMRLAVTQEIAGSGFSVSAFGDEYLMPANSPLTCQLSSSTPLPVGVILTSGCKLEASSTTAMSSSTTDITINWVAHHGASNSYDVDQNHASPTEDMNSTGSVGVRISLRKPAQLTAGQLFQMKLLTAKFSGTARDWGLAVDSYRALPIDQVPVGAPDAGILAANAVEQFESGALGESSATSAVDAFANQAAPQSAYLAVLRARVSLQSTTNLVAAFETSGATAKNVRQRILVLPASAERTALLGRFDARAQVLFRQSATSSGDTRTLVFSNPYQVEHFTVPAGVTQLTVQVQGAEGSQGGSDSGSSRPDRSGFKGQIRGTVTVSAGQVLTIGVGEAAGDAPSDCLSGSDRIALDGRVAHGGVNPLGGYAGGNGGSPGVDGCSGYGGAGGAGSVVQIGDGSNPASVANLVAGGSAGSSGSSDQYQGKAGLSIHTSRSDTLTTNGQSALALWSYTFGDFYYYPSDGGGDGGGGGGAVGGAIGGYDQNLLCGYQDYCPLASSPGQNSTSGLSTLTASYVPYTFSSGQNANGKVTISYVEPPASSNPSGGSGGGTASPSPSASPSPNSENPPAQPTGIVAVPFWKGADVSWSAPVAGAGSPSVVYEVIASSGQTCQTEKLTCRLTGLTPGQLLEVTVIAKTPSGLSSPAPLAGPKRFIPLSINVWQVRPFLAGPEPKLLNRGQLASMRKMLIQDRNGFVLNVRLATNQSKLSKAALKALLAIEIKALKGQLAAAGLGNKVSVRSAIMPPNSSAPRPSFILLVRKS